MIFLSMYLSPSLCYSDIFRLQVTDVLQSKAMAKREGSLQGCIAVCAFIHIPFLPSIWCMLPCNYANFNIYPSFFLPRSLGSMDRLSGPLSRPISWLRGTSPAVAREGHTQAFEIANTELPQHPKGAFLPMFHSPSLLRTCLGQVRAVISQISSGKSHLYLRQ